jgi:lipid-binding SYLF domain-containing protein
MNTMRLYAKAVLPVLAGLALILGPFLVTTSDARTKSMKEINTEVDRALRLFEHQVKGGRDLLNSAKGVLVIPNVVKAGLGLGGEYGEGALRAGGKTVAYYNIAGGSAGFQIGAEKKDLILIFMQEKALDHFRKNSDWTAGFDAGVTYIDTSKEKYADVFTIKGPVVAFVLGERGLMVDASIEGVKFSKMEKAV